MGSGAPFERLSTVDGKGDRGDRDDRGDRKRSPFTILNSIDITVTR